MNQTQILALSINLDGMMALLRSLQSGFNLTLTALNEQLEECEPVTIHLLDGGMFHAQMGGLDTSGGAYDICNWMMMENERHVFFYSLEEQD